MCRQNELIEGSKLEKWLQGVALWASVLLVVSMMFSPFLLSASMWILVAVAIWHVRVIYPTASVCRLTVCSMRRWYDRRGYFLLSLLFATVLASGMQSDNMAFWLEKLRIRLPFLVLPWAFANLPGLRPAQLRAVPLAVQAGATLFCVGAGVNFLLDPETILFGLREGQPVPVPRHHIRFNLMAALGVLSGIWFLMEGTFSHSPVVRRVVWAMTLFLFGFIHVLSVRSGIVVLYGSLFYTVIYFLRKTGRWKLGLIAILALAGLPAVAVLTIPSLKARIDYMAYDLQKFRSNTGGESYSDSERLISLETGLIIWKENPWTGCGIGDLADETRRITTRQHPEYDETPKLPHNQFLYILSGMGILGLLASLPPFLYPVVHRRYRKFYLMSVFQIMVFISFMVEYTLETSIGAAFYLFYTLWLMKMADETQGAE